MKKNIELGELEVLSPKDPDNSMNLMKNNKCLLLYISDFVIYGIF